jgi:putative transcriptional regulator
MMSKDDLYLGGKLLLANPAMNDPRFHRAVILVCTHDKNGAMGLVINHTLSGVDFRDLVGQLKIESDIRVDLKLSRYAVMSGGPVESARGFLLHSKDFEKNDTLKLKEGFGVTGTVDALKDVIRGQGPEKMLFALGYAGWSSGQLDEEIQNNTWTVVEADENIVFDIDYKDKWNAAFDKLGIDVGRLSVAAGTA